MVRFQLTEKKSGQYDSMMGKTGSILELMRNCEL